MAAPLNLTLTKSTTDVGWSSDLTPGTVIQWVQQAWDSATLFKYLSNSFPVFLELSYSSEHILSVVVRGPVNGAVLLRLIAPYDFAGLPSRTPFCFYCSRGGLKFRVGGLFDLTSTSGYQHWQLMYPTGTSGGGSAVI